MAERLLMLAGDTVGLITKEGSTVGLIDGDTAIGVWETTIVIVGVTSVGIAEGVAMFWAYTEIINKGNKDVSQCILFNF